MKISKTAYSSFLVLVAVISFLILVSSTALAAQGPSNTINETQITTGGTSPYPVIYGDKIVYPDYRSGSWKIYVYDLSTNIETQVSTTGLAFDPDIYADKIVWEASNGDFTDIYMYDLSSQEETRITTSQCAGQPAIYGDIVVWRDCRNGKADIYMYNIATKTETQVSTSGLASNPDIYGDRVVWANNTRIYDSVTHDFTESNEIDLYSLSTQQTQRISMKNGGLAKIYGDSIVIFSYGNLYLYDIPAQKISSLIFSGSMGTPNFYGDIIVYADGRNGYSDLYMFNLSTQKETQLTNGEIIISDPDIYSDRIVYGRNYNGFNVYMGTVFVEHDTTIVKSTPTIEWDNPEDIIYGTSLGTNQLNAVFKGTDGEPLLGAPTYTPSAGTVLNAGTGQILNVKFTPTDTANYTETEANVSINVRKATPLITWNNPADIVYGTALGDTQLNAVASVPGTFEYTLNERTPATGTILNAGTQTLHTDFTPTDILNYSTASKDVTINVLVPAPIVNSITVPLDPVPVNTSITASANVTYLGSLNELTAEWNWGDGSISQSQASSNFETSHMYSSAGVYTVSFTVKDNNGGNHTRTAVNYVVVYNPEGGFVTGGGWINSPEGAYIKDSNLTGKATFGFVSKYQQGATVPTGKTEFQFKVANLDFKSTSYDWLVVAGSQAKYKGTGTINGEGNYGFMLSAVDGATKGDSIDKFRIKIWDKENNDRIIYDNEIGTEDDAEPLTAIGGGSIIIHKEK